MAFCFSFRVIPDGNLFVDNPQEEIEDTKRDCIVNTAESFVGKVIEKTGRNDHPMIDTFFVKIGQRGLVKAKWQYKPWCAAFTGFCLIKCGVTPPAKNIASVASWEADKGRLKPQSEAKKGDVVTYTTWSHVEIVKYYNVNPRVQTFRTIGGNTEDPSGSEQYGVWEKTRQKRTIRKVINTVFIKKPPSFDTSQSSTEAVFDKLLPDIVQEIDVCV